MSWPWIFAAGGGAEILLGVVIGKLIRGPRPPSSGPRPTAAEPYPGRGGVADQIRYVIDDGSLVTVFQPIVETATGTAVGFEALSRFAHLEPNAPPQLWFARADRSGVGLDLELLAAGMALDAACALPDGAYVALNVSPAAVATGRLDGLIKDSDRASRTVLEISGPAAPGDRLPFAEQLARLRQAGVRVAISCTATSDAFFTHALVTQPDQIKIDRSLTDHADTDQAHRARIGAVVGFAHEIGAIVIAEGIETSAELSTVTSLGVDAVQGFLIGEPDLAAAWTSRPPTTRVSDPLTDTRSRSTGT